MKGFLFGLLIYSVIYVHPTTAVVIPGSDPLGRSASGVFERADASDFVTMYGLFDQAASPNDGQVLKDGSPKLRPVAEVFLTMKTASPTVAAIPGVTVDQPPTTASPLLEVISSSPDSAFTAPPSHFGGPGPVMLPSSAYRSVISPTSKTNDSALGDATSANVLSSKRLAVLGTIIGGIFFFTLCLFLIMSPACSGSLLGCVGMKKTKQTQLKERPAEQEKVPGDTSSWVSIPSPSSAANRASLETVKEIRASTTLARGDTVIDVVAALSSSDTDEPTHPASKFSMCSSEYPPSSCSSTSTSDLASNSSTVKAVPVPSKEVSDSNNVISPPVRPPRPPTTESPALSDSVYLACSDLGRPYVIVSPQPLTDDDLQGDDVGAESPRKLLTSTEFAALHVGRLSIKRGSSDSRHSRARSAPAIERRNLASSLMKNDDIAPSKSLFGSRRSCVTSTKKAIFQFSNGGVNDDEEKELLEDIGNDSDVQESMVRRVMKHRRSRSASGWAYPSRGRRSRRPFKRGDE